MRTPETVHKHGRTGPDEDLLPTDEYEARVGQARRILAEAGIDGFVLLDRSSRTGRVAYFTGCLEAQAAFLLLDGQPPAVAAAVPPRDEAFFKSQTWVERVYDATGLARSPGEALTSVLADLVPSSATLGVDFEPSGPLAAWRTVQVGHLIDEQRRSKRPREELILAKANELARAAVAAGATAFADGGSQFEAAIEAEHFARRAGAHDARAMANLYGEALAPLGSRPSSRRPTLALYCALEWRGYWGEAATTEPGHHAAAATAVIDAMSAALVAGAPAEAAIAAARSHLSQTDFDRALSYGLATGVGLTPEELPSFSAQTTDTVRVGDVVVLRAIFPAQEALACASRTFFVGPDGARPL